MSLYDDPLFKQAGWRGRKNFGDFLNRNFLTGTFVEIGVHRGFFARQLLDQWQGRTYIGIDPWEDIPEYADQVPLLPDYETGLAGSSNRLDDLTHAARLLKSGGTEAILIKGKSESIVKWCIDSATDGVYVDGNHYGKYIRQDMEMWWPKVKPGGILAGHDLLFEQDPAFPWSQEILPVVRDFAHKTGRVVWVIEEDSEPWSWYIIK